MALAIEKIFPVDGNTVGLWYMNDSLGGVKENADASQSAAAYDLTSDILGNETPAKVDGFGKSVFGTDDDGWQFGRAAPQNVIARVTGGSTYGTNNGFFWYEGIARPPSATSGVSYFLTVDDGGAFGGTFGAMNQLRFRLTGHDLGLKYRAVSATANLSAALTSADFSNQVWVYFAVRVGVDSTTQKATVAVGRMETDTNLTHSGTDTLGSGFPPALLGSHLVIGGHHTNSDLGLDDGVISVIRFQHETPPDDAALEARFDVVRAWDTDDGGGGGIQAYAMHHLMNNCYKDPMCGLGDNNLREPTLQEIEEFNRRN